VVGSSWGGGAATDRVALLASAANSISSNLAASHSSDGHSQDITGTGKRPTRPCLQLLSRPEKKPATRTQPKKATKQHKIQSRQLEKANVGKKKKTKYDIFADWVKCVDEDDGSSNSNCKLR
jgi:hypothetical protein